MKFRIYLTEKILAGSMLFDLNIESKESHLLAIYIWLYIGVIQVRSMTL